MKTIKSYTDLEQSKTLAEILPIESADMRYHTISHYNPYACDEIIYTIDFGKASGKDISCWSLAALLDVLNCPDLTQTSDGGWFIRTWYENHPYSVGGAENPVDACVEMIIKLHELKML